MWLSPQDVATLTGRPVRRVYELACEHHWRRLGRRPVVYCAADVLASVG